jgi:hypothetical protein
LLLTLSSTTSVRQSATAPRRHGQLVLLRLSGLAVVFISDSGEWRQIYIVVEAAVHVEVRLACADPEEAVVGRGSWRRWSARLHGGAGRQVDLRWCELGKEEEHFLFLIFLLIRQVGPWGISAHNFLLIADKPRQLGQAGPTVRNAVNWMQMCDLLEL